LSPSTLSWAPMSPGPGSHFVAGDQDCGGDGLAQAPAPAEATPLGGDSTGEPQQQSPGSRPGTNPGSAERQPSRPGTTRDKGSRPGTTGKSSDSRPGTTGRSSGSRPGTHDKKDRGRTSTKEARAAEAAGEVREFLERQELAVLGAWLRHFDLNNDQRISLSEFIRGMRKLNFVGDVVGLFKSLDTDHSGELSLEEIDDAQASMWNEFRMWCVDTFTSSDDMLTRLGAAPISTSSAPASPRGTLTKGHMPTDQAPVVDERRLTRAQFEQGCIDVGWGMKYTEVIFNSLDVQDKKHIGAAELAWLENELFWKLRKDDAKKRALHEMTKSRKPDWKLAACALVDFKQFLKKKYGHYIRAWRVALCPDTSMAIRKNDLFKACANIGWQGDVRLLYKAFDKDDSGFVSIEELDAKSAEILAQFWALVTQQLGGAAEAFRALDKHNARKLRPGDFADGLKRHGFQHSPKLLFKSLDVNGSRTLVEKDFLFLDAWNPPKFLWTRANPRAAEEVKALLVRKYKNNLMAWRQALDTDGSNHCTFSEFEATCKKINYGGDVAGAWRHLDDDLSGFITLHEIDPEASDHLLLFKKWCDDEFGNIKSAFGVFDDGGNNEVSYREFRRACQIFGFKGDEVKQLFKALDAEGSGSLTLDEVAFIDSWEFNDESEDMEGAINPNASAQQTGEKQKSGPELTQYITDGPGPAKYAPPTTIGAKPEMPMVRNSGAYSFRRRLPFRLPGMGTDVAAMPSPQTYDDHLGFCAVMPSKPSCVFTSQERYSNHPVVVDSRQPGPSDYCPMLVQKAVPSASCMPRRQLKVHPLFRDVSSGPRAPRESQLHLPPL